METPSPFSLQIPPEFYEDLDRRIKQAVAEAISCTLPEAPKSQYLTRKEVCKMLSISLPTLISYCDRGILHALKIGNRVLFDPEGVTAALKNLPVKSGR